MIAFNFHELIKLIGKMDLFLDRKTLLLIIAPHIAANTIKLIFLRKLSLKNWISNIFYGSLITLALLTIFKKEYLRSINPKNTKAIQEYYDSILTNSFYTSLILFHFRFIFTPSEVFSISKSKLFMFFICCIGIFFSLMFNQIYKFSFASWGKVDFDQIMYNLMNPTKDEAAVGFTTRFIERYAKPTVKDSIVVFIVFAISTPFIVSYEYDFKFFNAEEGPSLNITLYIFVALLFVVKLYYTINDFEIFTTNDFATTKIYEQNYVNPGKVDIQFPEHKRNLIMLYLESFENTFASKEKGGAYKESLIPFLETLFDEPNNVHFSHTTKLGGFGSLPLMCWSAAGIFSTQSGIPLKPFYFPNMHCFPFIITMSDILNTNGYNNHLSTSTPYESWGTSFVFYTHNTNCHGPAQIFEEKPKYLKVKRSRNTLYDYSAYDYAKEKINEISKEDKPFFMAINTIETHFPNGIICPHCKNAYPNLRNFNKARRCADKLAFDFIRWVQSQPFANNTTIVILGDHLCMGSDLFKNKEVPNNYARTVFNLIINTPLKPNENIAFNRKFSPFYWFPTVLASIGAKIPGERLGLGTNLFSGVKTLAEREPNYAKEIPKYSKFYSKVLAGDSGSPMLRIVPKWSKISDINENYIKQLHFTTNATISS